LLNVALFRSPINESVLKRRRLKTRVGRMFDEIMKTITRKQAVCMKKKTFIEECNNSTDLLTKFELTLTFNIIVFIVR